MICSTCAAVPTWTAPEQQLKIGTHMGTLGFREYQGT
ncbi:hypothetical protein ES707_10785 [subsurface metagenome]